MLAAHIKEKRGKLTEVTNTFDSQARKCKEVHGGTFGIFLEK